MIMIIVIIIIKVIIKVMIVMIMIISIKIIEVINKSYQNECNRKLIIYVYTYIGYDCLPGGADPLK
jgi:hypothetical protein